MSSQGVKCKRNRPRDRTCRHNLCCYTDQLTNYSELSILCKCDPHTNKFMCSGLASCAVTTPVLDSKQLLDVCLPSVRLCNIRGQAVSKNQHPLRLFLQAIFDHFRNSERSGITPAD
ncbi:hypothetical protein J6590_075883 [Homalodisca vitripennis]|nr:hypothetical protein J6590_075883 [Homalodisca vitripennis]